MAEEADGEHAADVGEAEAGERCNDGSEARNASLAGEEQGAHEDRNGMGAQERQQLVPSNDGHTRQGVEEAQMRSENVQPAQQYGVDQGQQLEQGQKDVAARARDQSHPNQHSGSKGPPRRHQNLPEIA